MDIFRCGSRKTVIAPAIYFTGTVFLDPIIETPAPATLQTLRVTFMPRARTFWHTHPLGQTLYVVSGLGLVQTWGEKAREIRAGDVVWIPPAEKHWHGAGPETAMVHIALQEREAGNGVTWLEEVTDVQFDGPRDA